MLKIRPGIAGTSEALKISRHGFAPRAILAERQLTTKLSVHYTVHNMKAITYTAARENLASTMDDVCRDRAPVIITRNRDQSVVMLSLDDYEELEETAYLLRSPENAKRLLLAVADLKRGKGKKRKIDLAS
jgi:antitoxin YefM